MFCSPNESISISLWNTLLDWFRELYSQCYNGMQYQSVLMLPNIYKYKLCWNSMVSKAQIPGSPNHDFRSYHVNSFSKYFTNHLARNYQLNITHFSIKTRISSLKYNTVFFLIVHILELIWTAAILEIQTVIQINPVWPAAADSYHGNEALLWLDREKIKQT